MSLHHSASPPQGPQPVRGTSTLRRVEGGEPRAVPAGVCEPRSPGREYWNTSIQISKMRLAWRYLPIVPATHEAASDGSVERRSLKPGQQSKVLSCEIRSDVGENE